MARPSPTRIDRGPLPVKDTVEVARQIMQALDAAHETGIVHRDLKPGNVALTRSGTVKVLDFGLAKAGANLTWAPRTCERWRTARPARESFWAPRRT